MLNKLNVVEVNSILREFYEKLKNISLLFSSKEIINFEADNFYSIGIEDSALLKKLNYYFSKEKFVKYEYFEKTLMNIRFDENRFNIDLFSKNFDDFNYYVFEYYMGISKFKEKITCNSFGDSYLIELKHILDVKEFLNMLKTIFISQHMKI